MYPTGKLCRPFTWAPRDGIRHLLNINKKELFKLKDNIAVILTIFSINRPCIHLSGKLGGGFPSPVW